MPTATSYPGVYIEEVPSGVRTITGVATSITAFVGYTARGPVNRAVRVLNFAAFERTFGGLTPDAEVAYAVQQFFLNGGTDAYVVRVARDARAAAVTLKYGPGAAEDALVVRAANEGGWGNSVRIAVDYATSNPDSTFNLRVTRYDLQGGQLVPGDTELFRNLSMNRRSSTYALSVVNAASALVRLELAPGLAFDDTQRGFSLSGDLSTFPAVTPQDTVLAGVLNGVEPFTLVLPAPPPTSAATLLTRVTAAIVAAGLADRLEAVRATAVGADLATGNFLKLRSVLVAANPATATEFSSVEVRSAPANDVAARIRMGLANGGREWEGARFRRPLRSGTSGTDLAASIGTPVSGQVRVAVDDNTTSPAAPILAASPTPPLDLAPTPVGPGLATALQALIRGVAHPAAQQATVSYEGSSLRVTPSAATPNASIVLSEAGATAVGLAGAGSFVNVQEYAVGTGATFAGQEGAVAGNDGTPPDAAALLGSEAAKTGMNALIDVDLFNLMAIPRTTQLNDAEARSVIAAAVALCERRRAFYLVDPDPARTRDTVAAWAASVGTAKNAALYFPRILVADPADQFRPRAMPASGAVAGVMARTDSERGIWKAPAGTDAVVRGAQGLATTLSDQENGTLNPLGVNCLRTFPVYGTVVWGARTMAGADALASEWKYVPVRRVALFIEESLYRGTQWVVFEPNDEPLWSQIRLNVGAFMHTLFRQGAFQGTTPRQAYLVKCDSETTTQNDVNLGIVNILVGFAPLKPAEFVILRIQQLAGQVTT